MTETDAVRALEAHYRRHAPDCWYERYGRCAPDCEYDLEIADDLKTVREDIATMREIVDRFVGACFVDHDGRVYEADFGDLTEAHRLYRESQ